MVIHRGFLVLEVNFMRNKAIAAVCSAEHVTIVSQPFAELADIEVVNVRAVYPSLISGIDRSQPFRTRQAEKTRFSHAPYRKTLRAHREDANA